MGITAEEILKLIEALKDSVEYWKVCQPWIVPADLIQNIEAMEATVRAIVEKQKQNG